jgi:AraC-like DNA-binding protein
VPNEPVPQASLTYIKPSALSGVELLGAANNSRVWSMFHERYCICGCSVAATSWTYRGKQQFTGDNSIGLMEPGETHRVTKSLRPSHFNAFFVEQDTVSDFAREAGLPGVQHFRTAQISDPVLFAALARAATSIQDAESPLDQQVKFFEFLSLTLGYAENGRSAAAIPHAHSAIRRARDLLQSRFNEPVTLAELSEVAHLSRFHLVRSFTREMGLPPHAYQLHVRIERARQLLSKGLPAGQVASAVGFSDQSHFTRHFKRAMRISPSEYARAVAPQTIPD